MTKKRFLLDISLIKVVIVSGCIGTSYKTYTNQYMSFQYPDGWSTDEILVGLVLMFLKARI